MKFASFCTESGQHGVGVVTAAGIRVLLLTAESSGTCSPMRQLLAASQGQLASLSITDDHPLLPLDEVILQPPVPDPSKIIAAPVNYRAHGVEMHEQHTINNLGVFLKAPSSLLPPGGVVRLPYNDRRFDQEGELAVVIGRRVRNASVSEVTDSIAGYTCLLDMTMRGGEERSMRKSFDSFTPMGPYLVTPDELEPLENLMLRCSIDNEIRQKATIGELIWPIPKLVAYASSVMQLEAGDIISTGTPAGVGQVNHGQRVHLDIDRVGSLRVTIDASAARPCPTRVSPMSTSEER